MVSLKVSNDGNDTNSYFAMLSTGLSSISVFDFFLSKFELNEIISFGETEKAEYSHQIFLEQSR